MPRYKLTVEYAGTRYSGWQIQQNAKTVQGEIVRAIREGTGAKSVETYGSGRTDAGVHALGQVMHADLPLNLPPHTLIMRINDALPADINILDAERVSPRFHARHSAVARHYRYQISTRRTAFDKPYVWWVRERLDLARMQAAADALTGFADFRSFTDDDPEEKSTQVLLTSLTITDDDPLIIVRVSGSHFLWKMVRRLVGVIVEVGRGGLEPHDMTRLLSSDSDLPPKLTAPASGLFLEHVEY